MIQIAKRIDDTIEDGIYNVSEVAEKIGITRQQLARWRKGTSEPTAINLKNFCLLYNISADFILGIERKEKSRLQGKADCTKYTFLSKSKSGTKNSKKELHHTCSTSVTLFIIFLQLPK